MTHRTLMLCFSFLMLIGASRCKPEDPTPDPVGGKGGNAKLVITPYHHARIIDSLTVYIKYNAQDMPSSGVYDDSVRCVNSVATLDGLKIGKYYLFGKGWDPLIAQKVQGGMPLTISVENTQTLRLQVSEDGH